MDKKRLILGLIAIVASMGIALLIKTGIVERDPSLKLAYIGLRSGLAYGG